MSIEQALADLTAALDRNTAALQGAAAPAKPAKAKGAAAAPAPAAPAPSPAPAAAPAAEAAPAVTKEQIQAAGNDLTSLAELDRAAAIAILGEFGVAKMTAAPPAQIPAIHARVKKKLAELQGGQAATPSLV